MVIVLLLRWRHWVKRLMSEFLQNCWKFAASKFPPHIDRIAIKVSQFQRVNVGDDLGVLYYGNDHASILYKDFLDSVLSYQSNPSV
ncbi:MAG: hypothetical protein RBG13Loki_2663 [Promethearchaeota archaeon CR_4]|nr:MAG: hypothetical protein RBG13Loki_2663 [Candidatus Lokiarchaeota archaeon CR_4]